MEINRRNRQKRREWFDRFRSTLSCNRCGYSNPAALDFHHTTDDKEYSITLMVRRGMKEERIMAEVAKCEVLCANCHRVHHAEAGDVGLNKRRW